MKAQGYYGLLRQLTKGGGTSQLAKQKAVTTVGLEVPEEKAVLSTQQELWLQKRAALQLGLCAEGRSHRAGGTQGN